MSDRAEFAADPPVLSDRLIPPTLLNAARLDFYRQRWAGIDLRSIRTPEQLAVLEILGGAHQCPACQRFSWEPSVVAQICDPLTLEPRGEGLGLLVLTELYPFVQYQPLIRYIPGDLVEWGEVQCDRHRGPTFRFLGRWGDVVKDPDRSTILLFPAELASILDGFPELARWSKFEETRLTGWNQDLAPVLGSVHRQYREGQQRVSIQVAARFSPAVFPDAARALRRRLLGALLEGCTGLRSGVESGAIAVDVRIGVATELETAIWAN